MLGTASYIREGMHFACTLSLLHCFNNIQKHCLSFPALIISKWGRYYWLLILWQTINFLYKHWLPNNHKTSALPPLRWVYGQASHFHIQGQQNSVLILGLIFFSLLPKEPTGNQFTPQIRYQTAYFVSLSHTITIQLALTVKWGWSVIGQFHINQWFSPTQAKLKESVYINSGKKGQSTKISIVIFLWLYTSFHNFYCHPKWWN